MHASIACLLLCEDYVWVSLGKQSKAKQSKVQRYYFLSQGVVGSSCNFTALTKARGARYVPLQLTMSRLRGNHGTSA